MKRFSNIVIFVLILAVFLVPQLSLAQTDEIKCYEEHEKLYVYFFYGQGCPHCEKEEVFLEKIQNQYPHVEIKEFEIWNNRDNAKLLQKIGQELNFNIRGVPFLIIGNETVAGFYNEQSTGKEIQRIIENCIENNCPDIVAPIMTSSTQMPEPGDLPGIEDNGLSKINLPIIGEIDPTTFSLPLLTIIIAALDGFNPCAMWVLLFLISLLIGMKNRRRMWILGTTFILVSGIVYFFFLSAWLNLFLFIGFIYWIRILIGVVAIGSGIYHLNDYIKNKNECNLIHGERRDKIFTNIKFITKIPKFWLALIGIIIVAFAVNLIELVCSAGLPAIYTNVLAMADLPAWKYYLYLVVYILIFMLDDLIVFIIAMVTLQATGLSSKYTRYSNLIGGLIILILGILLILKPELLMFG